MIAKVGQAGGVCEGLDPVIKIIKHGILKYVCILIPVGLILFGLGDLGKAVIASDEKEVKAAQKSIVRRLIYGVAIFFVVLLVNLVFGLFTKTGTDQVTGYDATWKDCWNCDDASCSNYSK